MIKVYLFFCRFDQLNISAFVILNLLILTHLSYGYDSWRIRQRVLAGLDFANSAKELVVANAVTGKRLGQGWKENANNTISSTKIENETGIVIVTYPRDIDEGGKTLFLIPIYRLEDQAYPLSLVLNSGVRFNAKYIEWVCTSKYVLSKNPIVYEKIGTLQSKYAPAKCRISPTWLEKT